MKGLPRILPFHCLILIGCSISGSLAAETSSLGEESVTVAKAGPSSLFVSCSPKSPVVPAGGFIQLRAWATTSEGKPFTGKLTYAWSVSAGRIKGETAEARWDLENSKPDNYVATVRATAANKEVAECSLHIVVESSKEGRGGESVQRDGTRGKRETGRAFLLPAQKENIGYGLYSYLLLGAPPNDNSRERYLRAIEAYLIVLPDIAKLERYFAPSELNITYLPIDAVPPKTTDIKLLAIWVLDHYDYSRARSLIGKLRNGNREGPYFVSAPTPLSGLTLPSHYLWQDLSTAPAQLAASWVKEFLNQAAQEHFWETNSLSQVRLKIRSVIAILAMAWPEIQNSLDTFIKLDQSGFSQ